jgi:hypothetical protein
VPLRSCAPERADLPGGKARPGPRVRTRCGCTPSPASCWTETSTTSRSHG